MLTDRTILDRLSDEPLLLRAWNDVLAGATDDGPPSAEVAAFEKETATRISELSDQLAERTWKPSPVVYLPIPKADGGIRKLSIPTVVDRVVERALLILLDPIIDATLLPWCCGYRRGIGVTDGLRILTSAREDGLHWVARGDMKDCFDQIPRWRLLTRLSEVVNEPGVVAMVGSLLARRRVGHDAPPLPRGRGLHQGSPLSPALCNLYLDQVDRAIVKAGWMPVRYGDDYAIPASSRRGAEEAVQVLRAAAESVEMELNLAKTVVVSFDEGVPFLGEVLTSQSGRDAAPTAKPLETTVFVTTPGAWLRTRGERIVVQAGEEVLLRLNVKRVRQVVGVGRVGMTSAFIKRAARDGIDVVMVDDLAGYDCRLCAPSSRDPRARIRQVREATDADDTLAIATKFVIGKIQTMRSGVQRRTRFDKADSDGAGQGEEVEGGPTAETLGVVTARALATRSAEAEVAATIEELLGCEGAATRSYFEWMRTEIPPEWEFDGRKRRPPPDPVNALLSFCYTLLTNEAVAACEAAHLDPDVGFLHKPKVDRPSLALDLVEEFRPVLADTVVLTIVAKGMLSPSDFTQHSANGCRMSDRAKKVLLAAYEQRMLTLVSVPTADRKVSWRQAMYGQAKLLAAYFRGEQQYTPIRWR